MAVFVLSQSMKWNRPQVSRMVKGVLDDLKSSHVVTFKVPEETVVTKAIAYIMADQEKDKALEQEARELLEQMERASSEPIDRHKLFQMIKKKLRVQKNRPETWTSKEGRIEELPMHLAHLIVDGIWDDDLVDYTDEGRALKVAKQSISHFLQEVELLHDQVQNKIRSIKRTIIEGSEEWKALYDKFYKDELKKRGLL